MGQPKKTMAQRVRANIIASSTRSPTSRSNQIGNSKEKTRNDALAGQTDTHRKKQCACGSNEPTHQRLDHLARAHCSSDESRPVQRNCGADQSRISGPPCTKNSEARGSVAQQEARRTRGTPCRKGTSSCHRTPHGSGTRSGGTQRQLGHAVIEDLKALLRKEERGSG